jgi:hypothetical protein
MTGANLFTIGNQIAVQPDGTLIDVASTSRGSGIQPSGQQSFISVSTSKDAGLHWSGFQQIATLAPVQGCGVEDVCDPDTVGAPNPLPVRAGTEIPDVAVDPVTGRIYVVWADGRASGGTVPGVVISSSLNGRTWTPPVRVADSPVGVASFNGTVAVASDGTVGVLYYDFRDNTPAPGVPTTVRLAHSHDNGVTWTDQQTLGSTFDMENAPFARGFFLGDYQGLTAIGRDFLAFYSVAGTAKSTADVVAVRARPAA